MAFAEATFLVAAAKTNPHPDGMNGGTIADY